MILPDLFLFSGPEYRRPQPGRRSAVVDEVQRLCGSIVCVEVGPILGDDDRAALASYLGNPGVEHVPVRRRLDWWESAACLIARLVSRSRA
jgi:hypothetical protein